MSNADDIICVKPLTPTYSTLPRLNTTVLLIFVLLSPKSSWATKGALAALMARIATICIHSFVLRATKDAGIALDLDLIGCWFLLSETAVAVPLMLSWAPALQQSKARLLIKIWGVLVFSAAICSYVAVGWARVVIDKRSCSDENNGGLEITKNEVFARLESGTLMGSFDIAAVAAASFGLWICVRPESWSKSSSKQSSGKMFWLLEAGGLGFASVVLLAAIVLHERYMLGGPRIPMLLPLTSYEQWYCWVATGMIAAATSINWLLGTEKKFAAPVVNEILLSKPGSKPSLDLEWGSILGKPSPSYIR
jgi:hypothetical protein